MCQILVLLAQHPVELEGVCTSCWSSCFFRNSGKRFSQIKVASRRFFMERGILKVQIKGLNDNFAGSCSLDPGPLTHHFQPETEQKTASFPLEGQPHPPQRPKPAFNNPPKTAPVRSTFFFLRPTVVRGQDCIME